MTVNTPPRLPGAKPRWSTGYFVNIIIFAGEPGGCVLIPRICWELARVYASEIRCVDEISAREADR